MRPIIAKELADHFSSARFPLMMALWFLAALAAAHSAGETVRAWLAEGLGGALEGRMLLSLYGGGVTMIIAYLAPLAAIILGHDAIGRERSQGTLVKILAQPVWRDEVLAGKFLAGLFILALTTGALMILMAGAALATAGLAPTGAEAARLYVLWLLTVIYLAGWLAVALMFSVWLKTSRGALLASAALWVLLAFFIPLAAAGGAGLAGKAGADPAEAAKIRQTVVGASPLNIYKEAAEIILEPLDTKRLTESRSPAPLNFTQAVILVLPRLGVLFFLAGAAFIVGVSLMRRHDMR